MQLLTAVNKLTRSCTVAIEGSTDSTQQQLTVCTSTCCVSIVQIYTWTQERSWQECSLLR